MKSKNKTPMQLLSKYCVKNDIISDDIQYDVFKIHYNVKHFYGKLPYAKHLSDVLSVALQYLPDIDVVKNDSKFGVLLAALMHDTIEDTRMTYNDVFNYVWAVLYKSNKDTLYASQIADIIYALSNEKGKNRAERANKKYYRLIRRTRGAVFVKLCDRMANMKHSKETNTKMINMYRSELNEFLKKLKPTFMEKIVFGTNEYQQCKRLIDDLKLI